MSTKSTTRTRSALARRVLMLLALVMATLVGGTVPANATSACDYSTRNGHAVFGNYVTPDGGGSARSSCATAVTPQRLSDSRVNFSGWLKDTSTDGRVAVLRARFNVGGSWGIYRDVASQGYEGWRSWTYPVNAAAKVYMVEFVACRYGTEPNGVVAYTACGDHLIIYNF